MYSEKATKFCEIFTLLLSYVVPVKSKMKISQNFVAFSEYMNFTILFRMQSYWKFWMKPTRRPGKMPTIMMAGKKRKKVMRVTLFILKRTKKVKKKVIKKTNNLFHMLCKVEKIYEDSLDSIPSRLPSVKIQIIGGKLYLR